MRPLAIAATAVAVVLGLATAAPVPRGADRPVLYFPTKVGTKWVYRGTSAAMTWEVTQVVTAVNDEGGAKVVTVEVRPNGTTADAYRVAVSGAGVFKLGGHGTEFERPSCTLKL